MRIVSVRQVQQVRRFPEHRVGQSDSSTAQLITSRGPAIPPAASSQRVPRSEATLTTALRHQRTLAGPCTVTGFGYWSGRDVNVELRPAPPLTGIVFV